MKKAGENGQKNEPRSLIPMGNWQSEGKQVQPS